MISIKIRMQKAATVVCITLLTLFGLATFSYGSSFYVDKSANGSNNGTSWTHAWKSFADINWSAVGPGDTVYISGGGSSKTYKEKLSFNDNGTFANRITVDIGAHSPFPANHNGEVIIDGGGSIDNGVDILGSYLTLKNVSITNTTDDAIYVSSESYVIVDGVKTSNILGRGFKGINCDNCIVRNMHITTVANNSAQTDGIGCFKTGGNGCDDFLVEYNWIKLTNQGGGHNDCIQGNQGTDWTIRHNYCENTKDSEGYADAQGIYVTEMSGDMKIYGNVVYLKQGGVGIANRNLSTGDSQSYIINNTVKCGSYRCIRVSEENDPVIKNNLVWQYRTAGGLLCIQVENWSGTKQNIEGNLCYNQSASSYANSYNGSGRTWEEWTSLGFDDEYGVNQDPSLDSYYRPDDSGDPSVDAGEKLAAEYDRGLDTAISCYPSSSWFPVATVDRDIAGGGSWDIGAYEYTGTNGSGLAPPSHVRVVNSDFN